jgi:hypothetical protein
VARFSVVFRTWPANTEENQGRFRFSRCISRRYVGVQWKTRRKTVNLPVCFDGHLSHRSVDQSVGRTFFFHYSGMYILSRELIFL